MTSLYTHVAVAIVAAALASGGTWRVQEWRHGAIEAKRLDAERVAKDAADSDARQQRLFNDTAAGRHAADLAGLNTQLGDARARIALLSSTRQCLDAGTVRLLNDIGKPAGGLGLRTPAGDPARAAAAAAGSGADAAGAGASEQAAAQQIAICRSGYATLSSQVNQILDIEERRQRGQAGR